MKKRGLIRYITILLKTCIANIMEVFDWWALALLAKDYLIFCRSFVSVIRPSVVVAKLWHFDHLQNYYLCNRCLSPLILCGFDSRRKRCTTQCDKVCQWPATGRWFSPGTPVSSINKTDHHDITEIVLKVALIKIKQINQPKLLG